jgi:3-dehydrosphinganine reductase
MVFAGVNALVTGGSSGIGLAIARELAARGAHVHIAARRAGVLAEACKEISRVRHQSAPPPVAHVCDVASERDVAELFAALGAQHAEPGILVNSAGVSLPGYFEAIPLEEFNRVMQINFTGTLHVLKQAVPLMRARGGGHILNVGSVASLIGVFGMTPYCASKFAVRGLSDSLRSELKPHGIVVSLLCPPDTDTPMLAFEARLKPRETEALSKSAGVISAAVVAKAAIRGMERGRALIVPGLEGRFTALAQRLMPGMVERISDRIVRAARA